MIQTFRNATQSFVIWIVLGVLALAFGLSFGLPSDAISLGDEPLVKVDGDAIKDGDYQYEYMAISQMMMPRSQMDPKFMELMGFKEEVLEAVIERELLADVADQMGMEATQADAEEMVLKGHMIILGETVDLLRGDKFNYDWFKRRFLPAFNVTEAKYLEYLQDEILARTVRDLITASTPVAQSEVRAAYDKRSNQVSIRYARFQASSYADLVDPSEAEVSSFLAEHKEELQKAYAAQGVRFTRLGKQVRLRFIQITKPKETASEEAAAAAIAAAKAKIDAAAARLAEGEDMRALARELSDDPGTARRGGDYGWVSIEGTGSGLEYIVDETAKELEVGTPSAVVEGDDGFYIVQVDGVREGDVPEEEALRELAEEALMRSRGKDLARQAAQEALEAIKGGKAIGEVFKTVDEAAAFGGAGGIDALLVADVPELGGAAVEGADVAKAGDDRPLLKVTGLFAKEKPMPSLGPDVVTAAWEAEATDGLMDRVFVVGDDFVLAGVDRKESGTDEGFAAAKDAIYRELRELRAMRLNAYYINRVCREAKAHGDITGSDLKLERLMVYDTKLGVDDDGKRVLRPYVICDRVGNRGGMARVGASVSGAGG